MASCEMVNMGFFTDGFSSLKSCEESLFLYFWKKASELMKFFKSALQIRGAEYSRSTFIIHVFSKSDNKNLLSQTTVH